jgi:hypothetical protein
LSDECKVEIFIRRGVESEKLSNLQGGHRLVVVMTLLESIRYRKHVGFAESLTDHLQADG